MKMKKNFPWLTVVPFIILVAMLVIFGVLTNWQIFALNNIESMFNQAFTWIVAGLGMVFVATMGSTDITHGALLCLAGGLACLASTAVGGGWIAFPVAMAIGLGSGALLGTLNAKFKANSFMMSLAMMLSFRAMDNTFFTSTVVNAPADLKFIDSIAFKIIFLIILFVAVLYLYNYTPYGTYLKGIGENEVAMTHVGIKVPTIKIVAFIISGVLCAVAAVFNAVRVGGINQAVGVSFEMNVMMCMFIGGIPVEGGMKSQLYKIIVGAFTIIILTNGLTMIGADSGYTQLIKGIVLLAVIALTQFLNRKLGSLHEHAAVNQKKADNTAAA